MRIPSAPLLPAPTMNGTFSYTPMPAWSPLRRLLSGKRTTHTVAQPSRPHLQQSSMASWNHLQLPFHVLRGSMDSALSTMANEASPQNAGSSWVLHSVAGAYHALPSVPVCEAEAAKRWTAAKQDRGRACGSSVCSLLPCRATALAAAGCCSGCQAACRALPVSPLHRPQFQIYSRTNGRHPCHHQPLPQHTASSRFTRTTTPCHRRPAPASPPTSTAVCCCLLELLHEFEEAHHGAIRQRLMEDLAA